MAEESSGFPGRWARRKTDVLQGKPVLEPAVEPVVMARPVLPELAANELKPVPQEAAPEPPALSLEDAKLLTKDSDFKPFMAQNVGADVRNAAMKKLFSDPHFNVMDGLDIYIDDYSKSDPIPEAMLRAMTSSKFLKLFDDENDDEKDDEKDAEQAGAVAPAGENANTPADQSVAQSFEQANMAEPDSAPQVNSSQPELLNDSVASQQDHDNPHLRLQPDHAAPAPDAGSRT